MWDNVWLFRVGRHRKTTQASSSLIRFLKSPMNCQDDSFPLPSSLALAGAKPFGRNRSFWLRTSLFLLIHLFTNWGMSPAWIVPSRRRIQHMEKEEAAGIKSTIVPNR